MENQDLNNKDVQETVIPKIYSYKAKGNGHNLSGRVCAENMDHATYQVFSIVSQYGGGMNVKVTQMANQELAMKEWQAEHGV